MKNLTSLLLFLLISTTYAQINFEKGYIINNQNETVDCYIKNLGWQDNPSKITYRLGIDHKEELHADVATIKEFGIGSDIKFRRHTVQIDKSSNKVLHMSNKAEPEFVEETIFLKSLIEGKANLYYYEQNNMYRFFYNVEATDVEQLIYKKYKVDSYKVGTNKKFLGQLFNDLKCEVLTAKDFKHLDYNSNDLIKVFIKYNTFYNGGINDYLKEKKKGKFNFKVRAGMSLNSVEVIYDAPFPLIDFLSTEFDDSNGFKLGVEAEYILPFNKNKWGLFIAPTYHQKYTSDSEINVQWQFQFFEEEASVEYSFVEIPIGVRHYFYLNDANKSKIFINAAYVVTLDLGDSKITNTSRPDLEIDSRSNLIFGIGYNYDKYSIELNTSTARNILSKNISVRAEYLSTFSINLAYTLF